MLNKQFYLTLPSDSSLDIYGDNKISSFCVSLSNPLELDSNLWEVGIVELIYPNLFVNIRQGRNSIHRFRVPEFTEQLTEYMFYRVRFILYDIFRG